MLRHTTRSRTIQLNRRLRTRARCPPLRRALPPRSRHARGRRGTFGRLGSHSPRCLATDPRSRRASLPDHRGSRGRLPSTYPEFTPSMESHDDAVHDGRGSDHHGRDSIRWPHRCVHRHVYLLHSQLGAGRTVVYPQHGAAVSRMVTGPRT